MYPAATCFLPSWRKSFTDIFFDVLGFFRTEKIVPTGTFTSILEDPSNGSIRTK